MKKDASLPKEYFDKLYEKNPDPWSFETSDYEQKKYADTISMLPGEHYENALEIGCSIGVLTALLSEKCTKLLAIEPAEKPLEVAKKRLADKPHVHFKQASIPNEYPEGKYDLVLMSEVGYYLSQDELDGAREKIVESLEEGGHLILVHWTHEVDDYPLTGDEVHITFLENDRRLNWIQGNRTDDYRIDVFEKE